MYALNPIQNSPQYRAYRARQHRDGDADDQKWPDVLEDAFLNGKQTPPFLTFRYLYLLSASLHTQNGQTEVLIYGQASWPERAHQGIHMARL